MTDDTDPAAAEPDRRSRLHIVADARSEAAAEGPADVLVDESEGGSDDEAEGAAGAQDWAWVSEWRESGEPTPWVTGLPLAAFAAVLAGVAIWVLSAGLAARPALAIALNLLVAGGLAPAMWLSRKLPVLRWFAGGAAVGVVGGWVAALMMLSAG